MGEEVGPGGAGEVGAGVSGSENREVAPGAFTVEALKAGAARFREYEAIHRAKRWSGDPPEKADVLEEKIERNRLMAEMLEKAAADLEAMIAAALTGRRTPRVSDAMAPILGFRAGFEAGLMAAKYLAWVEKDDPDAVWEGATPPVTLPDAEAVFRAQLASAR